MSGSESESEHSTSDNDSGSDVDVDFEACPILESDANGIVKLLKQVFLREKVDTRKIADFIISQKNIGSILREYEENAPEGVSNEDDDEEDDILGLSSYIKLTGNDELTKPIVDYLIDEAGEEKTQIRQLFESKNNVWVINERFINLPWQLSLKSMEQISSELDEDGTKFDYYIFICKILRPIGDHVSKSSGNKRKKNLPATLYVNSEEEILDENSQYSFEFSVENLCDSDHRAGEWDEEDEQFTPFRKVLFLNKDSWSKSLDLMKVELKS